MEINLHNYEAFFLDYKEGSLSHEQEKELFLFLESYPNLYEELHGYENVALEDFGAEENFANKNFIKKPDYNKNSLIAYTEGLLDEKQKKEIDTIALQNTAFKKELTFYNNTRIQPDLSEKFKNKSKLKRGGLIIALQNNYTFLRMAAAVLLLIGFFFLVAKLNTNDEIGKNKIEVAEVGGKKQEQRSKNKEAAGKQLANSNGEKQELVSSKQLAANNRKKQDQRSKNQEMKNKDVVINVVQTSSVLVNNAIKNNQKDSAADKIIVVENNKTEQNQNTNKSYFNYSTDKEDEAPVTASAITQKKSFFQKLVKVAKKVNDLGVKKITASEENESNSLSIGSFVVAETKSY